MDHFRYQNGEAHCENLKLAQLAAEVGTPAYVYSTATLQRHCRNLKEAFASYPTLPCFAVKANSNLSVLKTIFAEGFGADLVSVGELERSYLAGVKPDEIVFSGVGKRRDEIETAIAKGIYSFNIESVFELDMIEAAAKKLGKTAPVSLRVNPNVDAKTNPKIATGLYTTKFGLAENDIAPLLDKIRSSDHMQLVGLACHIGSQITALDPLREAAERMASMATAIREQGHDIVSIDMGGGLGIRYRDEEPPGLQDYANTLIAAIKPTGARLLIEPGRVVVGNAGILLTEVIGVKETPAKRFVVVDAAMNDLLRPSVYNAYHEILPVVETDATNPVAADIVGPICETGDILGRDRHLETKAGELLMIRGCGAYAASMASQYNSRPRAPEVLVDGSNYRVVRPRESLTSLWQAEAEALQGQ